MPNIDPYTQIRNQLVHGDPSGNYYIAYSDTIKRLVEKDPSTPVGDAAKKAEEIAEQEDFAYKKDKIFYRWLLMGLVAIVGIVVVGCIWLNSMDKTPSDGMIAIGSSAAGALVGLFSSK